MLVVVWADHKRYGLRSPITSRTMLWNREMEHYFTTMSSEEAKRMMLGYLIGDTFLLKAKLLDYKIYVDDTPETTLAEYTDPFKE